MTNSAKFQTIKDCIDSFMDGYSFSEAILDATNAHLSGQ